LNLFSCPSCHSDNRRGVRYCTQCGFRLQPDQHHNSRLVVLHGDSKGEVFELISSYNTIGRDPENHVILMDEKISKQHAAIVYDESDFWIEDLQSRNGVYLNGQSISSRERLSDGKLIKIGMTIMRFERQKR